MAHPRKFRFGVQTHGDVDAAAWRAQARKMEDLGYSTLFMPDHFSDTRFAPMVAIAVAAEATTTLRVGMLVLGNDYKHPAVVAKEAATLDVLSDGRLELGLGAGWQLADKRQHPLPGKPFRDDDVSMRIHAMYKDDVLGNIDTHCCKSS